MEKDIQVGLFRANAKTMKARIALLISSKADLRKKTIIRHIQSK